MAAGRLNKTKVLFICVHNSARSQIAETFLNALAGDRFEAQSAGLNPSRINPLVVEGMRELGFDLSPNEAKSAFKFYQEGRLFDYVITVCKESIEKECPVFPGITKRFSWGFDDPEKFEGTHEEKLEQVRKLQNTIKLRIEQWIKNLETA